MGALDQDLYTRVDELIRSHKRQQLLSTTGAQLSIAELIARCEGHEKALREIAEAVEKLAAAQKS